MTFFHVSSRDETILLSNPSIRDFVLRVAAPTELGNNPLVQPRIGGTIEADCIHLARIHNCFSPMASQTILDGRHDSSIGPKDLHLPIPVELLLGGCESPFPTIRASQFDRKNSQRILGFLSTLHWRIGIRPNRQ
ncbi:MAG: hypothetical protein WD738_08480 [Pirellulales bacterium]